jgi:glycosyltransferase involved in cell wall biosynthesis
MCEDLVRTSRLTVVHGDLLARWLRAQLPDARIDSVVHWLPVPDPSEELVAAWRVDLGVESGRPLVATFGHIASEHRIELILEALADIADDQDFVFVAVGAADSELAQLPAARRLGQRARWTGHLSDLDFGAVMCAADIAINLRYPTARASSGTQQQLLQLGTPTVIHDLVHLRGIPDGAVQRVPTGTPDEEKAALRSALLEWLADPAARRRAAAEGRQWAQRTITREAMAASYVAAVGLALTEVGGP